MSLSALRFLSWFITLTFSSSQAPTIESTSDEGKLWDEKNAMIKESVSAENGRQRHHDRSLYTQKEPEHFKNCWDESPEGDEDQAKGDTAWIGVLVDSGWYEQNGNEDEAVRTKVREIVKFTSDVFRKQMNIGLEISPYHFYLKEAKGWKYDATPKKPYSNKVSVCEDNISVEDRLAKFNLWRWDNYPNFFAAWILFTACHPEFINSGEFVLGIANVGTVCSPEGVAVVSSNNPVVFAHELGHVFGATHPCDIYEPFCGENMGIMSAHSKVTGEYRGVVQYYSGHQYQMCHTIREARRGLKHPMIFCWKTLKLNEDLGGKEMKGYPKTLMIQGRLHHQFVNYSGCAHMNRFANCHRCKDVYDYRLNAYGTCTYHSTMKRCVPYHWARRYAAGEDFTLDQDCPDCPVEATDRTCNCRIRSGLQERIVSCAKGEICNYDECTGPVYGCMDRNAHNYRLDATVDDNSCETCSDGIKNGDEVEIDCGGRCKETKCEWVIADDGENCRDACTRLSDKLTVARETSYRRTYAYFKHKRKSRLYVDLKKMRNVTDEQCENILRAGTSEVLGKLQKDTTEGALRGCYMFLSKENNETWENNCWYKTDHSDLASAYSKKKGYRRACPCTTQRQWQFHHFSLNLDHKCKETSGAAYHYYCIYV